MPFVDIRLAGSASREQKAAIVADVTRSLVERLGKPAAAVQVVIQEMSTENYGAGGILIADRAAAPASTPSPALAPTPVRALDPAPLSGRPLPRQEVASANEQE